MIARFVWLLPSWVHTLILALTGWRVVVVTLNRWPVGYRWTRQYPL